MHARVHARDKSFLCGCGKGFIRRGGLRRHVDASIKKGLLICRVIKELSKKENRVIKKKIENKKRKRSNKENDDQLGKRPFACDICHERFGYKHVLKRHIMIHTGEQPFGCQDCPKRFRDRGDLVKHNKGHKKD